MTEPEGSLTPAQYEILEAIWNAPHGQATIAEIWSTIGGSRGISRTTVLNQVDRLEKRGWLKRHPHADGLQYTVTKRKEQVNKGLAQDFVDSFFGGSASELLMSLLGSKRVTVKEAAKLRALLETRLSDRKS